MPTPTDNNNKSAFWTDLSKRGGVWSAVAGFAVPITEGLEAILGNLSVHEKTLVVAAIFAVGRAVIGLVAGKQGDQNKATFNKPQPTETE